MENGQLQNNENNTIKGKNVIIIAAIKLQKLHFKTKSF